MIALLWGAICGVLALVWCMVESMSGRMQAGDSAETHALWLILAPICAIGAMVHGRRIQPIFGYKQAVALGLLTTVYSATFLVVVWVLLTTLLVPDYQLYVETGITMRSIRAGENMQQLAQRIQSTRMLRTPPMLYAISFLVPAVVGSITSVVAALGLRQKANG